MNERDQEFKSWCEVAEILSLEVDNKVLCKETDFDQLLLMYDESISEFQNNKTTLKDLPVELARHPFQTKKCNSEKNKPKEVFVDKLLKELETKKCDSEKNKPKEVFVDKLLKELETKKCDSEKNKPKDKPLEELERQDETEK
ncbi:hypothetical protein RhiirB3_435032 [Rhizophagus irregularis]|nr:hypothetical protein RhiirB3_435032 [Rhizophagus irregularis]